MRIWPGTPYPLGATWDGWGTNFALFSEVANRVELCLFVADGEIRIDLTEVDAFVWHGYVPEVGSGTRYGYRVHGPWDPVEGFLCNPAKLLLDPYAKAVHGAVTPDDALFGYDRAFSRYRLSATDSAPYTMKSVVINPFFDWEADRAPRIPYHETVIYEAHVRLSAFFDLVQQDPVVSQVKLIAEPWDVGDGGYHVGNFPPLWSEWNGKYRDTIRDYWRGQPATVPEFASRLTGSSDLYQQDSRRPVASVNFVTAHDGFTLANLVSYDHKHNEANGEDNRDGSDDNRSWNCGAEGPTDDPGILALRARQKRNFLATLLLSQGVPMLLVRPLPLTVSPTIT